MRAVVSGATGFVGSRLVERLERPLVLSRSPERARAALGDGVEPHGWDPAAGLPPVEAFRDVEAIFHLAGDPIAEGRWTKAKRARIRDSRVIGTRNLVDGLAVLDERPKVLVCASAIGYYGDRGDEELDEKSGFGTGFLADVCQEWEEAAEPARVRGIRVVNLRIGVVLSPKGGALATMLTPFKLGAGGVVGSGDQYWSWIAIDDLLGAIHHAIITEELSGAVNAAAPNPVTNREFTKTLGRVLHRPTVLPMPAFAAKLALGEMANELLLASARVVPKRLLESGYEFRFPELEGALRHVLGR